MGQKSRTKKNRPVTKPAAVQRPVAIEAGSAARPSLIQSSSSFVRPKAVLQPLQTGVERADMRRIGLLMACLAIIFAVLVVLDHHSGVLTTAGKSVAHFAQF